MKKQATRKKASRPGDPAHEAGHVEESITRAFRSIDRFLKRYWKGLVGIVVLTLLVIAAYQIMDMVAENAEEGYQRRLYTLTRPLSPSEGTDGGDQSVDLDAIRELAADVEGAAAEKAVLKRCVEFLLNRAAELAKDSEREDGESTATDSKRAERHKELLEAVEMIIERGRRRFPTGSDTGSDDSVANDIQLWAANVQERIDVDREDKPWLRFKQEYGVLPVKEVPGDTSEESQEEKASGGEGGDPGRKPADDAESNEENS